MSIKKRLVILTGAGISAESGIMTYRDAGGLWEGYDVRTVASPEGWKKDRELVLEFYNQRRKQMMEAEPNEGHKALVKLEKYYDTAIITQNIDILHEKAGSKNIMHLHGRIDQSRSTLDPNLVYTIEGYDLKTGDKCERGSQLRPNIVWFGEDVPEFRKAVMIAHNADILLIIGTSLVVYPANTLVDYSPNHCEVYLVDPIKPVVSINRKITFLEESATAGLPPLVEKLIEAELMKNFK